MGGRPVTSPSVAPSMNVVDTPSGDTWLALTSDVLDVGAAHDWAIRPDCGAVVVFSGTVRDHAGDRQGVTGLDYEAYEEQVIQRLAAIDTEIRHRWPETGRVALWHRTGEMGLGEVSVVVAVSTPHRPEAFAATRFGIDAIKATAPIWKRETWSGGESWGLCATEPVDVSQVPVADPGPVRESDGREAAR